MLNKLINLIKLNESRGGKKELVRIAPSTKRVHSGLAAVASGKLFRQIAARVVMEIAITYQMLFQPQGPQTSFPQGITSYSRLRRFCSSVIAGPVTSPALSQQPDGSWVAVVRSSGHQLGSCAKLQAAPTGARTVSSGASLASMPCRWQWRQDPQGTRLQCLPSPADHHPSRRNGGLLARSPDSADSVKSFCVQCHFPGSCNPVLCILPG